MMVDQLVADLSALPGITVALAAIPPFAPPQAELVSIKPDSDVSSLWQRLIAHADIVWPIAPETGGALQEVAAKARQYCNRTLISDGDTLAVTSSKRRTTEHLAWHGIAAVPTYLPGATPQSSPHGWVVKPDDGAGAEDTYRSPSPPPANGNTVVQPYVPGEALSLSLLARDGEAWLLSCNVQDVSFEEEHFVYRGFVVGGAEHRRAALEPIAEAVAASLPGLWGYVGIDVIDAADGPMVLEINPRLTTSYAGLGRSLGLNPAGLVLDLMDRPISALRRPLLPQPIYVPVPA
jgi:predicted ATP-grasp superfamily ATP-dependent carboligase